MNFKTISLLLVAVVAMSFTQRTNDECEPYFPMSKGTTWTYNEYDKKGELAGTNTTTVESINTNGGRIEYNLKAIHDGPKKKEKNHHEMDLMYYCENGVFKMSMEGMIPKETMDSFGESATVEIDQSEFEFPNSMNAGDKLKDASVTVKVSVSGMSVMNMTINITDRQIEKVEEVTTAAGTYNCALMTYKTSSKFGFSTIETSSKDWYSPKVGVVKAESYDKNGNLEGSRELISYKAGQ